MVGFGGLRDLSDGRFLVSVAFFFSFSLQDLRDGRFWWVTCSQGQLVLLGNKRSQ